MNTQFDYQAIRNNAAEILQGIDKPSQHDRCQILITCCIGEGMTKENQIIGSVHRIDQDLRHPFIARTLKDPVRAASGEPVWRKDPDDGYVLN